MRKIILETFIIMLILNVISHFIIPFESITEFIITQLIEVIIAVLIITIVKNKRKNDQNNKKG